MVFRIPRTGRSLSKAETAKNAYRKEVVWFALTWKQFSNFLISKYQIEFDFRFPYTKGKTGVPPVEAGVGIQSPSHSASPKATGSKGIL